MAAIEAQARDRRTPASSSGRSSRATDSDPAHAIVLGSMDVAAGSPCSSQMTSVRGVESVTPATPTYGDVAYRAPGGHTTPSPATSRSSSRQVPACQDAAARHPPRRPRATRPPGGAGRPPSRHERSVKMAPNVREVKPARGGESADERVVYVDHHHVHHHHHFHGMSTLRDSLPEALREAKERAAEEDAEGGCMARQTRHPRKAGQHRGAQNTVSSFGDGTRHLPTLGSLELENSLETPFSRDSDWATNTGMVFGDGNNSTYDSRNDASRKLTLNEYFNLISQLTPGKRLRFSPYSARQSVRGGSLRSARGCSVKI